MLGVFDEAAQAEGTFCLILDAIKSLLRQRLFRPNTGTRARPSQIEGSSKTGSLFIAYQPPPIKVSRFFLGAAISFSLFVIACALIARRPGVSVPSQHAYAGQAKLAPVLEPSDLMSVSDECADGVDAGCRAEPKQDSVTSRSANSNIQARRDELPFPSGRFGVGQVSYSFSSSGAPTRDAANSEFKLLVWYPATIDPNTSVPVDNVWQ